MTLYHSSRRLLVAAIVITTCQCLSIVAVLSLAKQSPQESVLRVENKTKAFQVVSIAKDRESIHVSLRNDYEKTIISYIVATSRHTTMQTDYGFSDESKGIAPRAIEDWRETTTLQMLSDGITILAVVFEDGTGDGEPQRVKEIKDQRYGYKVQISRILLLIENILKSPVADTPTAIDELESQITSLSTEPDDETLEHSKLGLHNQKESTLRDVEELRGIVQEPGKITVRDGLVRIKKRLEKRLSRLGV